MGNWHESSKHRIWMQIQAIQGSSNALMRGSHDLHRSFTACATSGAARSLRHLPVVSASWSCLLMPGNGQGLWSRLRAEFLRIQRQWAFVCVCRLNERQGITTFSFNDHPVGDHAVNSLPELETLQISQEHTSAQNRAISVSGQRRQLGERPMRRCVHRSRSCC